MRKRRPLRFVALALFLAACEGVDPMAAPPADGGPQTHAATDVASSVESSGRIVFASTRDGDREIYTMDGAGGDVVRLTADARSDAGPVWSPDGTRIAFVRDEALHLMDVDSGTVTGPQTSVRTGRLTWSPAGDRIAFQGLPGDDPGDWEIFVFDVARGAREGGVQLTDNDVPVMFPHWSPTGDGIAVVRDGVLTVISPETGAALEAYAGAGIVRHPAVSPDGESIVYSTAVSGGWELEMLDRASGATTRLTADGGFAWFPAWSPDGGRLAYAFTPDLFDVEFDVWVLDLSAATAANLTGDPENDDLHPHWRPEEASADLAVSVAAPEGQLLLGETGVYEVTGSNAGPAATEAELTVRLQYPDQSAFAEVPGGCAVSGAELVCALGELAAGESVSLAVPVSFSAFGRHSLDVSIVDGIIDPDVLNNAAAAPTVVDLPLDAPGVATTGVDVPADATADGEALAVIGVHVPAALVAGAPGDLFIPAALTPAGALIPEPDHWTPEESFIPGPDLWAPDEVFIPGIDDWVPGDLFIPSPDSWAPGEVFIPEIDRWAPGDLFIPSSDDWAPAGRLLFDDGATSLRVGERADGAAPLLLADAEAAGIAAEGVGGTTETPVELCAGAFTAALGDGDRATFTCGSLAMSVEAGAVEVELDDGTALDVPAGTAVLVEDRDDGGSDVSVTAGDAVTVTVGVYTFELAGGETAPDPAGDPDDDGLTTALEQAVGADPLDPDGDADGLVDGRDPGTVALAAASVDDAAFAVADLEDAFLARLDEIEALVAGGDVAEAVEKLDDLRLRVDGCGAEAEANDWIVECGAQRLVRGVLDAVRANLAGAA